MESANIILVALCVTIAVLFFILFAEKIFRVIRKIVMILAVMLFVVLLILAAFRVDIIELLRQVLLEAPNSSEIIHPRLETAAVHTNARIRVCPGTDCKQVGNLKIGDTIQSQSKVDGESINGNSQWVEFTHKGYKAYVWSGLVSVQPTSVSQPTAARTSVATEAPSATKQPTVEKTEVAMWSPRMCSYVYKSPSSPAVPIGRVKSSNTIEELERIQYRGENREITFVKFIYNGDVGYVNGARLKKARPPYYPTRTPVAYTCNCDKLCENMTCAEAFYQLVECGCGKRDSDNNGIPCNTRCEC